jgi:hypothetical protein
VQTKYLGGMRELKLTEFKSHVHELLLDLKSLIHSPTPVNPFQGTMGYQKAPWFYGDAKSSPMVKFKIESILGLLKVEFKSVEKIRLGGVNDGGYFVAKDYLPQDGIICLGVGSDISFEQDLASEKVEIHFYDDSVNQLPKKLQNSKFYKLRVGEKGISLREILERHKGKSLLLKCDVEGSEWNLFDHASKETLEAFDQIVVEFHHIQYLYNQDHYDLYKRVFEKLHVSHSPIHSNSNNYGAYFILGGYLVPELLEVTYINRRLIDSIQQNKFERNGLTCNDPKTISFNSIFDDLF